MKRKSKIILFGTALVILSLVSLGFFNKPHEDSLNTADLILEDNSVYLFLRGSETKLGGYARMYNRYGGLASHIALGVYKDSLTLYHLNTGHSRPLIAEGLESFTSSEDESYNHLSVWKIKGMTAQKLDSIQSRIDHYQNQKLRFDYQFDHTEDDALYCSEFVYQTLHTSFPKLFQDAFFLKEVPANHRFYLKKDTLYYLPVDFILDRQQLVELVFEWE